MTTYSSVPADTLARLQAEGRNHNGTPAARRVAAGGERVRCCLGDAREGEPLILAPVDLGLPPTSPYAGTSPVFVHAEPGWCVRGSSEEYPPTWAGRRQLVRAYDERGWIVDTELHGGQGARTWSTGCWTATTWRRCSASTWPTAATCSRPAAERGGP